MATEIIKCGANCPSNEFQDQTYGKGRRLANSTMKDNEYRCTICGSIVTKDGRKIK